MDRTYSADGTTIAFDRSGQGPALILVMGAFCDRSSTTSLASALASRFTVYEYDRRGRGDSGDTAPYSTRREVEDLSAIVDAAGGSAYAFGHSSGAAVALEAAASGVALLGVAAYEPPYTPGPSSQFADRLEALASSGREGDAAEAFIALTGTPPRSWSR